MGEGAYKKPFKSPDGCLLVGDQPLDLHPKRPLPLPESQSQDDEGANRDGGGAKKNWKPRTHYLQSDVPSAAEFSREVICQTEKTHCYLLIGA
jgi:hypothetical protein